MSDHIIHLSGGKSLNGARVSRVYGFDLRPGHTLVLSGIVCLMCAWTFLVVLRHWPTRWAMATFLATIFLAPALPIVCFFQFREHRFSWRLLAAFVLSLSAVTLLGLSFYLRVHP
jgi:hypothetical protein